LKYLVEEYSQLEQPEGQCCFFAPTTTGLVKCDQAHESGSIKLEQAICHSHFDLFIPENWDRFPYMMLVTRGRHSHPPPPPTRLPKDIADEVLKVLEKEESLTLTTSKYILSICLPHANLGYN
jgi:hypothetical protein